PLDHVALTDDDLAHLREDLVDEDALRQDQVVHGLDVERSGHGHGLRHYHGGARGTTVGPGKRFPFLTRFLQRSTWVRSMTKDKDAKEGHDFRNHDTRIIERSMKRGLISRKDYEKYLKSLPDSKDKVRPTND